MSPAPPATAGSTVTFDASTSTCDRTPCTYRWAHPGEFDTADGTLDTSASFVYRHIDLPSETHTVDLDVRNAIGETGHRVAELQGRRAILDADALADSGSDALADSGSDALASSGSQALAFALCGTDQVGPASDHVELRGADQCGDSRADGLPRVRQLRHVDRHQQGDHRPQRRRREADHEGRFQHGRRQASRSPAWAAWAASSPTARTTSRSRTRYFTSQITFQDTANSANLLLDHNTHKNIFINCQPCPAGRILAEGGGLTVQNSLLQGGDADGIQIGTPGMVKVLNNEFDQDLRRLDRTTPTTSSGTAARTASVRGQLVPHGSTMRPPRSSARSRARRTT